MTARKSLPPEVRARLYGWAFTVLVVCATVAAIYVPTERWEKLGRFLTDPATASALTLLGGALLALYMRARATPPVVLLLALTGAMSLPGCTPAEMDAAMHVLKPIGKWSCALARALCGKDDEIACMVIAGVCGAVDAISDSPGPTTDTSGGEVDAEPE